MKRFSLFIAWLLLVLMPLQVLAASNMSVCNSSRQIAAATEHADAEMPCHEEMSDASEMMQDQIKSPHNIVCESYCVAMCASLNVVSTLHNNLSLIDYSALSSVIRMPQKSYTSVVQSNLLRPPIFLL